MLGKRLAAARKRAGIPQVELAVALGKRYNQSMISNVETGRSALLFDGATKAARELDVSLDYLAGLTDNPDPAATLAAELAQERAKVRELEDAGALAADDAAPDSLRQVNLAELDAAAGDGAQIDGEQITGRIAFRRAWLARHGLNPTQCVIIGVKGESMEPTLTDGGSILIDRNRRSRRVGHIYVVRTDDGLIVKRAGKSRAGNWQFVSDNPDKQDWPTLRWPDDAEVIGEVKWAARTF